MLKAKTSVKYYQGTAIQTLSALCVPVSVLISDNPPYSGSLFQSNTCNFFPWGLAAVHIIGVSVIAGCP